MFSSTFKALALAAVLAHPAAAWFRLPCTTPVATERVDPIINPNQFPTNHVHTVQGGQNFYANSTYDTLSKSSCTTCVAAQDKSSYWYPKLYFKDPKNGQFEQVPNGGLDVYYLFRGNGVKKNGGPGLKAFPPGFRMISAGPTRRSRKFAIGDRSSQAALANDAVQWECIGGGPGGSIYDYKSGGGFPHSDCPNGFRADIHFPSCWDGKNLDSANHVDHVAYLSDLDNGSCPPTHPVTLPHLFFETFWDVTAFKGRWDGKNWPFVWSTGDPTGYSFHADFYNGWEDGVLQRAIDQCDSTPDQLNGIIGACPVITVQNTAVATKCKTPLQVNEGTAGPFAKLPGCNPIQSGPGDAILYSSANCPI